MASFFSSAAVALSSSVISFSDRVPNDGEVGSIKVGDDAGDDGPEEEEEALDMVGAWKMRSVIECT